MKKSYNALVMSGGGPLGSFQVGALNYLINEKEIYFDIISGISAGSLNASILAQKDKMDHKNNIDDLKSRMKVLNNLWNSIKSYRDIGKLNFRHFFKDGILSSKPLYEKIKENVDVELLKQSSRILELGTVSLNSGEYVKIDNNSDNIHDFILGGTAFPGSFRPVPIMYNGKKQYFVDGAARNGVRIITVNAVKKLRKMAESDFENSELNLYIILLLPTNLKYRNKVNSLMKIFIRFSECLLSDPTRLVLNEIEEVNEKVRLKLIDTKKYSIINIHHLELPQDSIDIKFTGFNEKTIQKLMEYGYQKAKNELN